MNIDRKIQQRLEEMFPGVILDKNSENELLIRTNNWRIDADEMAALREINLAIDSIYTEGDGVITLVMTKETIKKVIRK